MIKRFTKQHFFKILLTLNKTWKTLAKECSTAHEALKDLQTKSFWIETRQWAIHKLDVVCQPFYHETITAGQDFCIREEVKKGPLVYLRKT